MGLDNGEVYFARIVLEDCLFLQPVAIIILMPTSICPVA